MSARALRPAAAAPALRILPLSPLSLLPLSPLSLLTRSFRLLHENKTLKAEIASVQKAE